jgi:hypothetical protein
VLATGVIVAAYANRDLIRIKIASVYARVSPKPVQHESSGLRSETKFLADASWALSVLPECWKQAAKSTGDAQYVRAHLPPDSVQEPAGTAIRANDCTLLVRGSDAVVERGRDRLRLPAPTYIFRSPQRLSVFSLHGANAELRTYIEVR